MIETHAVPLCIPAEHPALAGHFPGNPLVPGVVVLERVAAACKAWRRTTIGMLDVKFMQPLRPGEAATIMLQADGARVRFEVTREDGQVLARGIFVAGTATAGGAAGGRGVSVTARSKTTAYRGER